MKKFRKFLRSKGGILAVLGTLFLMLIASFFIILGVIYGTYNGNWGKIPEVLSSDFAISVYIIIGLTLFLLIYVVIITGRNKEIK